MTYNNIKRGIFLFRPNRFIAHIEIDGKEEICHVKNTGRCSEILTKGCTVYLSRQNGENRKTKYDLVAAEKVRPDLSPLLINIDSQIPNYAVAEWLKNSGLFSEEAIIKRDGKGISMLKSTDALATVNKQKYVYKDFIIHLVF